MMKFEQVEKKIMRPPAAHNVARLLDPDSELKTVNNIARFAVSIPAFNYKTAEAVIRDRVGLSLELSTALKTAQRKGAPAGRTHNEALVSAFYSYDEVRGYSACRLLENYRGQFKFSRQISVPTAATFTILENGFQVPVVVCGWKKLALKKDQIRAWLSMLESGLFSIADYLDSPWEVVLFTEEETATGLARLPKIIRPGDYKLMSSSDLSELASMYARAQKEAMPLARELWEKREKAQQERQSNGHDSPIRDEAPAIRDFFAKTDGEL